MLDEPDAGLIRRELGQYGEHVSSAILRIELRRVALRQNCLPEADQLLSRIALVPLDNELLSAAETLQPPEVGTLDAITLSPHSASLLAAKSRRSSRSIASSFVRPPSTASR